MDFLKENTRLFKNEESCTQEWEEKVTVAHCLERQTHRGESRVV